jgi:GntR family transcriptional regulator
MSIEQQIGPLIPRPRTMHPPRRPDRQRSSRRAYDLLRAYLREIQPGQRLLDDHVAALLDTSRGSVRYAMHALVEEGVLTRAPRVGTTLAGQMMQVGLDELTATSMVDEAGNPRLSCTRLTHKIIPCAPYVRARLGIDDTRVQLIETLVSLDGTPVSVREAYTSAAIPRERFTDDIEDLDPITERVFGEPADEVESTVESISCSEKTAASLGVTAGSPMLLRETLLRGTSGRALMLNFTQYRGDRVALVSKTSRRTS